MSHVSFHVLIVEDDESAGELVRTILTTHGHRVELVHSARAALARLAVSPLPDVILLDVVMPEMSGIEMLRRYRKAGGAVPVIMVSAMDEAQTVVGAMRLGASDYITKPLNAEEMMETLERVVERNPLRASTSTSVITQAASPARTLGVSPAMRRVEALLDRVADADVPILLTGESGVGKDVVARELHARSSRRDRVFVKINCAALPETLLESELFGYERGAFTGAQRAKPGQFELADGGTLFLDEIGEMPAPLQAKLLQALQDGEFYRVGGQKKVRVDVRVIVATNVNLEQAIRDGRFREDLYYRLNVVQVRIPPLRERREDIPMLLSHFVERYGRRYGRGAEDVPPEVVQRFLAYDWPGNVRELENLVRRLMVLRDPSYVYAEMRARNVDGHGDGAPPLDAIDLPTTPPVVAPPAAMVASGPIVPLGSPPTTSAPPPAAEAPMRVIPFSEEETRPLRFESLPPAPPPPAAPAPEPVPAYARGGSYPFGGYASSAAGRPLGEVVAEEFAAAGVDGKVDLKALGRKAAEIAEREAIVAMLARTGGSKREAAGRLGISYKAILYKIREFGIGRPRVARKVAASVVLPGDDASPLPDDLESEELDDAFGEEMR
jgi:two-component system, NtrC family, response regulator AtoC